MSPFTRRLPLLAALILAACAGEPSGDADAAGEPLLVLAAASLGEAMPALIARWEAASGTPVDLALGSTGSLAAQLGSGAPADLFFSADEATVRRLAAGGHLDPASVRVYAVGELALVWRAGVSAPASLQALADPAWEVVAIANPAHAPYGVAAREALEAVGIWAVVEPRVVQGENVAQAYQLVRTGNADAALVARSVVGPEATPSLPVDGSLHAPIRQAAGAAARGAHPEARPFLDFVLGAEGQAILARHGFGPAPR